MTSLASWDAEGMQAGAHSTGRPGQPGGTSALNFRTFSRGWSPDGGSAAEKAMMPASVAPSARPGDGPTPCTAAVSMMAADGRSGTRRARPNLPRRPAA